MALAVDGPIVAITATSNARDEISFNTRKAHEQSIFQRRRLTRWVFALEGMELAHADDPTYKGKVMVEVMEAISSPLVTQPPLICGQPTVQKTRVEGTAGLVR